MDSGTSPTKCRIIVVGSNPSVKSASRNAFDSSTKSGRTVRDWLDKVEWDTAYFTNVISTYTTNNRPLTISEIKQALPKLKESIEFFQSDYHKEESTYKFIAVGKTAEKALTLLDVDFYPLPHPSGLNRKLNDPKFIEEKINGLRDYLNPPNIE